MLPAQSVIPKDLPIIDSLFWLSKRHLFKVEPAPSAGVAVSEAIVKDLHAGSCRISQIAYARILSASRNQEYSDPDDGDRVLDVRRISVLYLLNRCARKHTRAQGSKWCCKSQLAVGDFLSREDRHWQPAIKWLRECNDALRCHKNAPSNRYRDEASS